MMRIFFPFLPLLVALAASSFSSASTAARPLPPMHARFHLAAGIDGKGGDFLVFFANLSAERPLRVRYRVCLTGGTSANVGISDTTKDGDGNPPPSPAVGQGNCVIRVAIYPSAATAGKNAIEVVLRDSATPPNLTAEGTYDVWLFP